MIQPMRSVKCRDAEKPRFLAKKINVGFRLLSFYGFGKLFINV